MLLHHSLLADAEGVRREALGSDLGQAVAHTEGPTPARTGSRESHEDTVQKHRFMMRTLDSCAAQPLPLSQPLPLGLAQAPASGGAVRGILALGLLPARTVIPDVTPDKAQRERGASEGITTVGS